MHPLIQILTFIVAVISLQNTTDLTLWIVSSLIFVLAYMHNHTAWRTLWHLRWFFISILLVYAFTTPGEYLLNSFLGISLTREGITLGSAQILRLISTVLLLHILLVDKHTPTHLIAGIYSLLYPLQYLGWDIRRFITRIALALHYTQLLIQEKNILNFQLLKRVQHIPALHHIDIDLPALSYADMLVLLVLCASFFIK